jgi:signal transduction histidine kinase
VPLPEFLRTTTFRWTLALSAAFAAFVLLLFAFVYWQTVALATAVADRLNADEASRLLSLAPEKVIEEIDIHLRIDPLHSKLTGLFDKAGNRLAGNIAILPNVPDDTASSASIARIDPQGSSEKVVRVIARRLADGRTVVVARDYEGLGDYGGTLSEALALGLVPALFLALAAGTLLSLRAQRRVAEVTSKVQRIVAGELRERLPARSGNDPFDRLATLVNGMLDEIQRLVENLAGVGNDIAHDLRTPLTRLRNRLEEMRTEHGRAEQFTSELFATELDAATAETDQLLATFSALLRLTRIEAQTAGANDPEVAMQPLALDAVELYAPIASEGGIVLDAQTVPCTLRGDADQLFQLVANLLDNALKYAMRGTRVTLHLYDDGDAIQLIIGDHGAGIPAVDRERVFDRFVRLEEHRGSQGSGLGLSLVRAIAHRHGGSVALEDNSPGLRVRVRLPRAVAN